MLPVNYPKGISWNGGSNPKKSNASSTEIGWSVPAPSVEYR